MIAILFAAAVTAQCDFNYRDCGPHALPVCGDHPEPCRDYNPTVPDGRGLPTCNLERTNIPCMVPEGPPDTKQSCTIITQNQKGGIAACNVPEVNQ